MLRIADEHAGKRIKCPACSAVIASKPPEPAFEVVEDEPKQLATARPVARPAAKPRADEDDEDDGGYGLKSAEKGAESPKKKPNFRKRADDDDDDEDEPRPRKKKRRSGGSGSGADAGKRIGYVIGGILLAIIGSVIAYFASSGEGRRPYRGLIFGIILALGGVVMVFQGVTGNIPEEE